MNGLDAAILGAALAAGFGGFRLGFVARLFAWVGVAIGLVIAMPSVPHVVTTFGGTSPDERVTVALAFLVLAASLGQAIGLAIGMLVHRAFPLPSPLPQADRVAGAVLGIAGVAVLVWMVIPSLATAKGWPARLARDSWLVGEIQRYAPAQPARFAAWGRAIADAPFPSALGPLEQPPDPGRVPQAAMPAAVDARARASTLKVTGHACNEIQDGTGWVAAPGVVVTDAHVVAGEHATTVVDTSGRSYAATVVAFDARRDVAVLAVPQLRATPLPMRAGAAGMVGAVYGHPGGGPLVASPASVGEEITAVGTDIYRTGSSRRDVYVIAASLAPGDSGGAFVNRSGNVIGMAFAIDPGRAHTAYALTDGEIRAVLDAASGRSAPVSTGRCLVG